LQTVRWMFDRSVRYLAVGLSLALVACLDDPVGPSVMSVTFDRGSADTVWSGAPGEALPTIRIHVRDEGGRPVPGASVQWEAFGKQSALAEVAAQTNAAGEATAVWRLGTDAAEQQRLQVTVQTRRHQTDFALRARAVPYVVAQVRVAADTVLRVGDTLALHVDAIDPYGNVFPAPDVQTIVTDTTRGSVVGGRILGGPRRGRLIAVATSHAVPDSMPIHITQFVAAIVPTHNQIQFTSLGAALPVSYGVLDDRGRPVADTVVALAVSDSAVARLNGTDVISLTPGSTTLRLTLLPAQSSVPISIDQRIASILLHRDTIRFDALSDTITIHPLARDSLGFPVYQPTVVAQVQDSGVAQLESSLVVKAVTPGQTTVTVRDPQTGVYTSVPVVVHQLVTSIEVDPTRFDALGDTATARVIPRDRLGSFVADADLSYGLTDSSIAAVSASGQVRSIVPGVAMLIVRDEETGLTTSAAVDIHQRVANLLLGVDSVAMDALQDTVHVSVSGRDRLGALVLDVAGRTTFTSTNLAVVDVDAAGMIRATGNGDGLVIARSTDGPSDTVRVTIAQRVAALTADRDSVFFESLNAEQVVRGLPLDRLGSLVTNASVLYSIEDSGVARMDSVGKIRALRNGATRVMMSSGGFAKTLDVMVAQRAVRVAVPSDTIHLASLGEPATISGVALDSLGSPVAGTLDNLRIADTSIAQQIDATTVQARANGRTSVGFSVAGASGSMTIAVAQLTDSIVVRTNWDHKIISVPRDTAIPVTCTLFDRNGFEIAGAQPVVTSVRGTVIGADCSAVRARASGFDTLHFTSDAKTVDVPVIVAVRPLPSSPKGTFLNVDSLPSGTFPWAPTASLAPDGSTELYFAAYSSAPDAPEHILSDLHRLRSTDGADFVYDGRVLQRDSIQCPSLQGSGIENISIVPRSDGAGWRMFYAAGSFACYGWQVFSAVSNDGRNWTKEPGIRLSNGGNAPPIAPATPPYPVGEGMSVDRLPSGEWRMIVGTFEHTNPAPSNLWQIVEWRSVDQLNWSYSGPVLTTREMPPAGQGSVYSPTIAEIAPGIWRMIFTADARGMPDSRSALWSAVSTDRGSWQVEGQILGDASTDLYYATLVADRVFFIRKDVGGSFRLASATLEMH